MFDRYAYYQAMRALFGPSHAAVEMAATTLDLGHHATPTSRAIAAACGMVAGMQIKHKHPGFGIPEITINGRAVRVLETVEKDLPFCKLIRFETEEEGGDGPHVLIVAPMSGHYATIIRDMVVEHLRQGHIVHVTDWKNARYLRPSVGVFDLSEYVLYVIRFLRHLGSEAQAAGSEVHVVAVCQAAPAVLAAVSLMAEDGENCPKTMVLSAGPVNAQINPTDPCKLAAENPLSRFEDVTSMVPFFHGLEGEGRRVYPGFLQLFGFMSMNFDKHLTAHFERWMRDSLGDMDGADKFQGFYRGYFTVFDLTAELYLSTIRCVFQEHHLSRGCFRVNGRIVDPSAIRQTALMTIEAEEDDITGRGQTEAAHAIAPNIPNDMRCRLVVPKIGHYGTLAGSRYRKDVFPRTAAFIQTHSRVLLLA